MVGSVLGVAITSLAWLITGCLAAHLAVTIRVLLAPLYEPVGFEEHLVGLSDQMFLGDSRNPHQIEQFMTTSEGDTR